MLRKVFCDKKRECPISYDEFFSIGMSKNGYLSYIAHCDRLRSALMLKHYRDRNILSSKIKKEQSSIIDRIFQICFNELLDMLQEFCNDDLCLVDLAEDNITINSLVRFGLTYDGSMDVYRGGKDESPALLYSDFDRFRVTLEKVLCKLVNQDFPIFTIEIEPEMENMPLYELKLNAEREHDYEMYDRKPDFPTSSGKSADIFSWAEKAERYYYHQYFIDSYEGIEDEIAFREESIFDAHRHTLYIFKGNLPCKKKQHTLEPTKAVIDLPDINTCKAELDVLYCHECKRFYISETSYELYREKYGFLPICFDYDYDGYDSSAGYRLRAEKSPLMLCGYSVSKKNGLSRASRQKLLAWIMDHHIHGLEKPDIINHLELLIETNGINPNNADAREKWSDDLEFVHNYGIDDQLNVEIHNIVRKNRIR